MNDRLQSQLKELRLSGLARTLEVRCQEARGNNLSYAEFLELVLQDELLVRRERQIGRRVTSAQFRELKTLDNFNWAGLRRSPDIQAASAHQRATARPHPRLRASRPPIRRPGQDDTDRLSKSSLPQARPD